MKPHTEYIIRETFRALVWLILYLLGLSFMAYVSFVLIAKF